jgi:AAA+ superfamily predicted ATPase
MKKRPAIIGFRLPEYYREALEKEASRRKMTPNGYAREVLLNSLDDTETRRLQVEIYKLRRDVADALEALLTNVHGIESRSSF